MAMNRKRSRETRAIYSVSQKKFKGFISVAISDGIGGQWGKDEMCVMHWRKALLCF
jgi:hypothetical protein